MLIYLTGNGQTMQELDSIAKANSEKNFVNLIDYDKITIDIKNDELVVNREFYRRNYFLNNKATSYSADDISLSAFRALNDIEVYTEVPNGSKFKKRKTNNIEESVFIDNEVFFQDVKTFHFKYPELQEKAISNLRYSYRVKEPRMLRAHYFQNYFPIHEIVFIVDADKNVKMNFRKFHMDSACVDSTVVHKKNRIIYTFHLKSVKAIDAISVPTPMYYVAHIIPMIHSYTTKTGEKTISGSPGDLFNWYNSLIEKRFCAEDSSYSAKAKELVMDCNTEVEKVKTIYKWIQGNIRYIAIEVGVGGFVPDCPEVVFAHKYGDCKGMANLLQAMLKAVGVKSYLTWVGTDRIPYTYTNLPTPATDNHMITTYIDNQGTYHFLDATYEQLAYGLPPYYCQGKEVMIDMDGVSKIVTIPVLPEDLNQIRDSISLNIEESKLSGYGKISFSGLSYPDILNRTHNILENKKKIEFFSNYLVRGNNKFKVTQVDEHIDTQNSQLHVQYQFELDNYISRTDKQIFINLNLFKGMLTEKIDTSRIAPKKFKYKNSYKYTVQLHIPDDYHLKYLPEGIDYDNGIYKMQIAYSHPEDHIVEYELYSHYSTLLLQPKDFNKYNAFLKEIYKNFRRTVVLEKNNTGQ